MFNRYAVTEVTGSIINFSSAVCINTLTVNYWQIVTAKVPANRPGKQMMQGWGGGVNNVICLTLHVLLSVFKRLPQRLLVSCPKP